VTTDRFDIDGKAQGNPTKDQMRLMVQSLLADRFRLAVHYETRQLPVFALVLDKPGQLGSQLQKHPDDAPCPTAAVVPSPAPTPHPVLRDTRFPASCGGILPMPPSRPGRYRSGARDVTMDLIASSMGGMDRPVIDKTGLTGKYDYSMEYAPSRGNSQPDPTGPTLAQALREQLGLKLVPETGLVDVVIVDYAEQPPAN
jgi:uncharacterized protein (TIGR03435 family)